MNKIPDTWTLAKEYVYKNQYKIWIFVKYDNIGKHILYFDCFLEVDKDEDVRIANEVYTKKDFVSNNWKYLFKKYTMLDVYEWALGDIKKYCEEKVDEMYFQRDITNGIPESLEKLR